MEELLQVIPFHLQRYEQILQACKADPTQIVCALDLSFATRFIAVYLFLQVKSSRPMTYQYLTMEMIENAKSNDGYVDQKQFKTAGKYGFDSLLFTESDIKVISGYIQHVRIRLEPKCDYLLVNRNGKQYDKLSNLMTKMVYDAIGKYVHPTRYRQIIETESAKGLSKEEQDAVSEDQKHSSTVARVHYKKQRSREVAKKGQECLRKLQGIKGEEVDQYIQSKLCVDEESLGDIPTASTATGCTTVPLSLEESEQNNNIIKDQQEMELDEKNKPFVKKMPKRLPFTKEEDDNLKQGLRRHGSGQWSVILKDTTLTFQVGRKADSLKKRANSKFPELCH
ncbi:hypothetical protein QZH41_000144 [Actinostola sp. cb2023]|nr:hypothetical protein QZH41_000144 [Actinostola sp. cb2023]